jgi:PKD repeat protein
MDHPTPGSPSAQSSSRAPGRAGRTPRKYPWWPALRTAGHGLLAILVALAGLGWGASSASAAEISGGPARNHQVVVSDSPAWSFLRSATAADGTSVAVWVEDSAGVKAALRPAGSSGWISLPSPRPQVTNPESALSLELVAAPDGDFWLGWSFLTSDTNGELLFVSRLDTDALEWGEPEHVLETAAADHDDYAQSWWFTMAVSDDGTVTIVSTMGPYLRLATRAADSTWSHETVTGLYLVDSPRLAVGADGEAAVVWTKPVGLTAQLVAATRASAVSPWHIQTLAPALPWSYQGGGAREIDTAVTVSAAGSAAVAWLSDASDGAETLTVAIADIGEGDLSWSTYDAATGESADDPADPRVVVTGDGTTHLLWTQDDVSTTADDTVLMYTSLASDVFSDPVALSAPGSVAAMANVVVDSNDDLNVLYESSTPGLVSEGLRVVTVGPDSAGSIEEVTTGVDSLVQTESDMVFLETRVLAFLGISDSGKRNVVWGSASDGIFQDLENADPTASFTYACIDNGCTFNASSSADSDGTISTYNWGFDDVTGYTGNEPYAEHYFSGSGDYTVTLTVVDSDGATDEMSQVVTVEPPNYPPSARLKSGCSGLVCQFDASASEELYGSVESYAWDFGDGETGTGVSADHVFRAAGDYDVTLTVTDDDGETDETTAVVSVTAPAEVGFAGSRTAESAGRAVAVRVPVSVEAGDRLVLSLTVNDATATVATPAGLAGWTKLGAVRAKRMKTVVWTAVANASSAGSPVKVLLGAKSKSTLMLAVYDGVDPDSIPTIRLARDTARAKVRTTPAVTAAADDWIVSYWADASASATTTAWGPDDGVTARRSACGTGADHICSLLADTAGPVDAGRHRGAVASTNNPSSLATLWSLVLTPDS